MAMGVSAVLAAGWLSYRCVEQPFLRHKARPTPVDVELVPATA